jgi:hypothetical protein
MGKKRPQAVVSCLICDEHFSEDTDEELCDQRPRHAVWADNGLAGVEK